MIVLELLVLIIALVITLVVRLMPIISILAIVSSIVGIFCAIYYSKFPDLKMAADEEIPIEQVTFKPRNILKELHEERSL